MPETDPGRSVSVLAPFPLKELARFKVPHELIMVRGAGHGLGGGDKKQVADAHRRALAFIRKHLQ
jgi:hypothetical protein